MANSDLIVPSDAENYVPENVREQLYAEAKAEATSLVKRRTATTYDLFTAEVIDEADKIYTKKIKQWYRDNIASK